MADVAGEAEMDRIRLERDLYKRLLELGRQASLDPFLKEALALVVEVAGARQGYLELRDEESDEAWATACGFSSDQLAEAWPRRSRPARRSSRTPLCSTRVSRR
jgi:GAF domain-containing protein